MKALRIFCAEDDGLLRDVLVRLFSVRGHVVTSAADGAQAWAILTRSFTEVDVVVSDHQMPGLSGLALVERLRSAGYAGRIVIYSSSVSESLAAVYRGFGVAAIVPKSSRPDLLISSVERAPCGPKDAL